MGITLDLARRLAKHNNGDVRSTKAYRPWHLVYTEKFSSKTEARKKEVALKSNSKLRKALFDKIEGQGLRQ